jgi:translation elongation factor EF-G
MDRTGADFFGTVKQMIDRLGAVPVPIQIPYGSEENFKGIIDLVEMNALKYDDLRVSNFRYRRYLPTFSRWQKNIART